MDNCSRVQKYLFNSVQFSSVAQSCPTLCDPMNRSKARPPCPSPSPGVHSNSRPSSQRCHPAISSSSIPFSSCPQSLPASESFPMSQFFAWGQTISCMVMKPQFSLPLLEDGNLPTYSHYSECCSGHPCVVFPSVSELGVSLESGRNRWPVSLI